MANKPKNNQAEKGQETNQTKDLPIHKPIKRRFQGVVISDKMDKTIVVKVERVKQHSVYKKRFTVSKKYKVHDEKNLYKVGDRVVFVECRPLSRDKRWRVVYQ